MNQNKSPSINLHLDKLSFSGVVSIENDQNIIYQSISGMEDRDNNQPISRDTLFAIASGTKFLTALAIGKLIDQNKLSLDTLAKDVFDLNMSWINPNITIKQLLSHTSGMSDYLDEDIIDDSEPIYYDIPYKDLVNPKDFIPIFSKDKEKFSPGERFNYNNQGFVYLGIIIEELSKKTYKDFINEEILKPLNIIRSGIYHLNDFPPHTVIGYLSNQNDSKTNLDLLPYQSGGDGGAIFSVDDMRVLWESFFQYKIISKSLVDQFVSIQATVDEKSHNYYGLGVWLKKRRRWSFSLFIGWRSWYLIYDMLSSANQ